MSTISNLQKFTTGGESREMGLCTRYQITFLTAMCITVVLNVSMEICFTME